MSGADKKMVSYRLPLELAADVEREAGLRGESQAAFVERALRAEVERSVGRGSGPVEHVATVTRRKRRLREEWGTAVTCSCGGLRGAFSSFPMDEGGREEVLVRHLEHVRVVSPSPPSSTA